MWATGHGALSHSGSHGGVGAAGETAGRRDGVWVSLGDWGGGAVEGKGHQSWRLGEGALF